VSYARNDYRMGGRRAAHRVSLISARATFPSGLVENVAGALRALGLDVEVKNERSTASPQTTIDKRLGFPTPYAAQSGAVEACCQALNQHGHGGTVEMATGAGKTYTIALLIDELKFRTLIVVPNLKLKEQTAKAMKGYFGNTKDVVVENIDSPRLKKLSNFGMLIIDESHHSAARTYRQLNRGPWKTIPVRFCFTATPFRSNDEENLLMQGITGGVLYSLPYARCVEAKMIAPVEAYYIDLAKRKVKGYTWQQVYKELVVDNAERNKIISDTLANLKSAGKSTICLVKEVRHGENILKNIQLPFMWGENDDNERLLTAFNEQRELCITATNAVAGEGVDTVAAEYVIIAGLGKSRPAFMQAVGRAVRRHKAKETAKVIIFRDPSHKWSLEHFKAQRKVLREEFGVEPVKLEL
jgi:superfamily II DNA or RNA helicase